jgi:hypothetical protein
MPDQALTRGSLAAEMTAIESLRDQGGFRERLRRLLKESETEDKAGVHLTLPQGGDA